MKNIFVIATLLIFILQTSSAFSADYYSKSSFKKLPKTEQIKVLKEHKSLYLQKIDSKIKDVNAQIESIEQNSSLSISKKQSMILNLQQKLTTLNFQRSEIIERYDYKINSLE